MTEIEKIYQKWYSRLGILTHEDMGGPNLSIDVLREVEAFLWDRCKETALRNRVDSLLEKGLGE